MKIEFTRLHINIPCKDINAQSIGNDGQKATDGHEHAFDPKAALLDDLELVLVEIPTGFLDGSSGEVGVQGEVIGYDFGKVHLFYVRLLRTESIGRLKLRASEAVFELRSLTANRGLFLATLQNFGAWRLLLPAVRPN